MDKVIFEMDLDSKSSYITRKIDIIIELYYLKLIFKNGQVTISIWSIITLSFKGQLYFLEKEGRIITNIYYEF